ncbi:putative hydrolase of the HAD superfamily [Kineosphaera limosa]|uniref:Putative hydrolase n=1 Tax=Kineosphaera limosa NBRC 100340 TaxID=1184609 RepID=K6XC44_9MICO|nr:HAD-IA family hydrolase [Kineosphaera limosa]NYD99200.1 putative hydrolase of the HAD superfamily [Kineosphaera limosa]GAB96364.1 putative hydrolase [Kineosphaera limosa NBRC 100340]
MAANSPLGASDRRGAQPGEPVAAVLFDCDGVLQYAKDGWFERLEELNEGFDFHLLEEMWAVERPALRGEVSLREAVEDLVARRGLPPDQVDLIASLWDNIRIDPAAWQVVRDVRAAGSQAYLATNQLDYRRDLMLELGYADLVDGTYFSCDVGAAKPDAAYFEAILADLGLPAQRVVFVDDVEANVEAAATCGIVAVRHEPSAGSGDLRQLLASAGVRGV